MTCKELNLGDGDNNHSAKPPEITPIDKTNSSLDCISKCFFLCGWQTQEISDCYIYRIFVSGRSTRRDHFLLAQPQSLTPRVSRELKPWLLNSEGSFNDRDSTNWDNPRGLYIKVLVWKRNYINIQKYLKTVLKIAEYILINCSKECIKHLWSRSMSTLS